MKHVISAVGRFMAWRPSTTGFFGAVSIGLVAAPALAQDAWLRGEWCAGNGERMIVEASGPGFNEHTVCTWAGQRPTGTRINTRINCAHYYGDASQKAFERTERFRAVKTGPRSVSVRVGGGAAAAYGRC